MRKALALSLLLGTFLSGCSGSSDSRRPSIKPLGEEENEKPIVMRVQETDRNLYRVKSPSYENASKDELVASASSRAEEKKAKEMPAPTPKEKEPAATKSSAAKPKKAPSKSSMSQRAAAKKASSKSQTRKAMTSGKRAPSASAMRKAAAKKAPSKSQARSSKAKPSINGRYRCVPAANGKFLCTFMPDA